MRLSDLQPGFYFSFKGKKIVYFVNDIKYKGDYFGTFTIYYSKQGFSDFFKWTSNQKDSEVHIYPY